MGVFAGRLNPRENVLVLVRLGDELVGVIVANRLYRVLHVGVLGQYYDCSVRLKTPEGGEPVHPLELRRILVSEGLILERVLQVEKDNVVLKPRRGCFVRFLLISGTADLKLVVLVSGYSGGSQQRCEVLGVVRIVFDQQYV